MANVNMYTIHLGDGFNVCRLIRSKLLATSFFQHSRINDSAYM